LIDFANSLKNIKAYTWTPFCYTPCKTVEHFNNHKPSLEQVINIKDMLEEMQSHTHYTVQIDDNAVTDGAECANEELFKRNSICSGNMDTMAILPDGKITICEELYWDKNFIIGDLMTQTIEEIWNSERATSLWYIKQDIFPDNSACKKCESFETCRSGGKVCWKKVIAAYGRENWLHPDIICPKAPKPLKKIFYDNAFLKAIVPVLFFMFSFTGLIAQEVTTTLPNDSVEDIKQIVLDELVVKGTRPRQRITKEGNTIVAVSKIPGYQSSSVYDLLKKIPGVTITEQYGILLNGKAVDILIDDRNMPYVDMVNYIKTLPAYSLNEVELIPIKGAERDGNHHSSIINLKIRQQYLEGYFGNVMALGRNYDNDSQIGMGNVFVMLKGENVSFNTSVSYNGSSVKAYGEENTFLNGNMHPNLMKVADMHEKDSRWDWTSALQWNIRKGHSLYANFYLFDGSGSTKEHAAFTNAMTQNITQLASDRRVPRLLGSGNVEYKWNSLLTLNYGYTRGRIKRDEAMLNDYNVDSIVVIQHDEKNIESQHFAKIDFRKSWNKLTLRIGLKGTFSRQDNISLYTADVPITYQDVNYTASENVSGGYVALDYQLTNKIRTTIGGRTEYTNYSISNHSLTTTASPNYWNTYPTARFTYRPLDWYVLVAYASSKISRPGYGALLPGRRYIDDYNYYEGNPYLVPALSHSYGIQNTLFGLFYVSMDATFTNNLINQVKIDKGNGVSANIFMNAIDSRLYTLSASAPFSLLNDRLGGSISFSGSTGSYVNEHNGFKLPIHHLRPTSVNLSGFFNYQLASWMGLTANVLYNIKDNNFQTVSKSYATLDIGLQMNLLKSGQLSASVEAADVFKSRKMYSKIYYGDNNVLTKAIDMPTRCITVSLSYRFFGGKEFNPQINSAQNDIGRFTK
jgi:radical SAM protein with 4Fe4S-binding SPASM domain